MVKKQAPIFRDGMRLKGTMKWKYLSSLGFSLLITQKHEALETLVAGLPYL